MRFSAAFAPRTSQHQAARAQRAPHGPHVVAPAASAAVLSPAARPVLPADLPEDLDARVRLIGEWQLGLD